MFFQSGTPPPSVQLSRQNGHSRDKMDQVFPLRFYILQAIKNWTVGRSGNKAICTLLSLQASVVMKESHFSLKSLTPPLLRLTMRSYKVWHVTVVCILGVILTV